MFLGSFAATILSTVAAQRFEWIAEMGPLGWTAIALSTLLSIPFTLWNKRADAPDPTVPALALGLLGGATMALILIDVGIAEDFARSPRLLLAGFIIWGVFAIGTYLRLRRTNGRRKV